MRRLTTLLLVLLAGCASTPRDAVRTASPAAPLARTAPPAWPAPSRVDCPMVRALDGRAVCASPDRLAARRLARAPARPAPVTPVAHGEYVVIGSFAERGNAERWAAANAEFGTAIHEKAGDRTLYRVVVGPLGPEHATPFMGEILRKAGLGDTWPAALCTAPAGGDCAPARPDVTTAIADL